MGRKKAAIVYVLTYENSNILFMACVLLFPFSPRKNEKSMTNSATSGILKSSFNHWNWWNDYNFTQNKNSYVVAVANKLTTNKYIFGLLFFIFLCVQIWEGGMAAFGYLTNYDVAGAAFKISGFE